MLDKVFLMVLWAFFMLAGFIGCSTLSTADTHMTFHRYEKAATLYQDYLKEHPDSVRARNGLGFAYLQRGEIDKSVALFEEAVQLDPDNPLSTLRLGQAYVNAGMIEPAIDVWAGFSSRRQRDVEDLVERLYWVLEMYQGNIPADPALLRHYGLNPAGLGALGQTGLAELVNSSIEKVLSGATDGCFGCRDPDADTQGAYSISTKQ